MILTPENAKLHPNFISHVLIEKDYGIIEDTEGVGITMLAMLELALELNQGNDDYLTWLQGELEALPQS